jgi:IS30 family transposase
MTIASLMQQNYSQRDIAKLLGCSVSIVSRELGRNTHGKEAAMRTPTAWFASTCKDTEVSDYSQ